MNIKKIIPQSIKNIYHLMQAIIANVWYGFPSKKIKIIGVTGTNGKTTTVQMITKILEESGARVAMASTINFKLGRKEWVNATKFTTLSSFQVQKFIREAVKSNCEYLILEISSHSLDQGRTWGIKYDTAVITNVTREHLDYHKTMEKYRQVKRKLFKNAKIAVVNLDMEKPEEFLDCRAEKILGYTTKNPNYKSESSNKVQIIKTENMELNIQSTKYKIADIEYKINLPGLFNVENALAATCVGLVYKVSPEILKKALESLKNVPGRMEKVPNDQGLEIIIDYAVTPDSLEKVYKLIKNQFEVSPRVTRGETSNRPKIISVFGACGERDRGKRPLMGKIVSQFADYIILTNEDPYMENSTQIISEIANGIKILNPKSEILNNYQNLNSKTQKEFEENKNLWIIMDRRKAIKKALQIAKPGDIFVITGKGAEETMAIGKKRIPWNDKKVILEELEKQNC